MNGNILINNYKGVLDNISNNNTGDAIKILYEVHKDDLEVIDELCLIESRLSDLNRQNRIGVLQFSDYQVSLMQIKLAIINLCREKMPLKRHLKNKNLYSVINVYLQATHYLYSAKHFMTMILCLISFFFIFFNSIGQSGFEIIFNNGYKGNLDHGKLIFIFCSCFPGLNSIFRLIRLFKSKHQTVDEVFEGVLIKGNTFLMMLGLMLTILSFAVFLIVVGYGLFHLRDLALGAYLFIIVNLLKSVQFYEKKLFKGLILKIRELGIDREEEELIIIGLSNKPFKSREIVEEIDKQLNK